jgi:iduronate 2-sulfatase
MEVVARELYDHQDTRTPRQNLAADPQQTGLLARLSKQLNAPRRVETSKLQMKK